VEFKRVVQEIEFGVSRADALRSLAERLQVSELSSFVAVIVQSESLGMPISDVLHGQAEQMRIVRQFKAKEVASRLPAKMMFPLAFLILPALIAVILSPTVPSLLGLFGSF
jgi:tight adherence protein C